MASQSNFKLDTSAFVESALATKKLAETLENAIAEANEAMSDLYDVWAGKGRNEFEKKYKVFEQQVDDIRHGLWDLYEDIVAAEEGYIQADTDAAKLMSGVSEGNISFSDY